MKIDIENIQALEPNKIYIISINPHCTVGIDETIDFLIDYAEKNNLKFLFVAKDVIKFFSPEGWDKKSQKLKEIIQIIKRNVEAGAVTTSWISNFIKDKLEEIDNV